MNQFGGSGNLVDTCSEMTDIPTLSYDPLDEESNARDNLDVSLYLEIMKSIIRNFQIYDHIHICQPANKCLL